MREMNRVREVFCTLACLVVAVSAGLGEIHRSGRDAMTAIGRDVAALLVLFTGDLDALDRWAALSMADHPMGCGK